MIAMILMSANQNSSSPNSFTVRRFEPSSASSSAAVQIIETFRFPIQKSK